VRRAIGAGRWRIVRQLLVESVLLALGAAIVGLGLAALGLHLLVAQLPPGYVVGIDGAVLGFTLLLAVATGLGFGIVPALRASAPALEQSLRDGGGGTVGRQGRRARDILVVSEVALALVLLVGSALLVRSFISLNAVNPGFDPRGLLAARIRLTPARYSTAAEKRTFFDDVVQRLRTQPGVRAITIADGLPLAGENTVGMNPHQIRPDDSDQFLEITATDVGPDFFSTMGIPIRQGRAITADDRERSTPVCVVSEALAHRLWPDQAPIGQRGMGRGGDAIVVGVVGDVRGESLEREGGPAMYVPLTQGRSRSYDEMWVIVRSTHPLSIAPELRQVVRTEDAAQPIAEITTYDAIVQQRYASLTLITALITLFAGLALVLAVSGIAGVTAYGVSQRTRELGIRIALGARGRDVIGLLLSETVVLVGIGLALGLAAAFGVTRTLRSLLYGVTSTDLVTFGAAALALGLVALAATYVPARRAGRVDPVGALRSE
jgi:predicted permease